jgi:hypothetical protein
MTSLFSLQKEWSMPCCLIVTPPRRVVIEIYGNDAIPVVLSERSVLSGEALGQKPYNSQSKPTAAPHPAHDNGQV